MTLVHQKITRRAPQSADANEGIESFLEKRPARFPGHVSTDMPDFYPLVEDILTVTLWWRFAGPCHRESWSVHCFRE